MVNNCVNTGCREEWKLFGSGELYSLEVRGTADAARGTEFFWLCRACACNFTVRLDRGGKVIATPKSEGTPAPLPNPHRDLRPAFCFRGRRIRLRSNSAA